eukprot:TRINITY_DN10805_c0_g1_i1.p1 TRINITY_DN10805_c0_g1~~TRINITY_DN10805_c0_g1_i1.p1  ORF type:complete len:346 (+),score=100.41 TRINITY_DN10805_c0_g1_i1:49-1086(+)
MTSHKAFSILEQKCDEAFAAEGIEIQDAKISFRLISKLTDAEKANVSVSLFQLHKSVFAQAIMAESGLPIAFLTKSVEIRSQDSNTATKDTRLPFRAVVLDIEGTTTSISFVRDVLFPYAREQLSIYATQHQDDPEFQQLAQLIIKEAKEFVAAQATESKESSQENESKKAREGNEMLASAVVDAAKTLMDHDVKATGLKKLQGAIWKDAYHTGRVQGHLYIDAPLFIAWCNMLHTPVYIYSSGSVPAQKLLFGFSDAGDLCPSLAGHFDTSIGLKIHAESYRRIQQEIKFDAQDILFATDNINEATAAREAGWSCIVMDRPGNAPLPEAHTFPVASSLLQLIPQ